MNFWSMDNRIYGEPSEVEAAEGSVVVDGPDGVAVTLTPEAAEETASRLEDKSVVARGQRRIRKLDPRDAAKPHD